MPTSEQWAVIVSLLLLLTLGVVFPLSLVFTDTKGTIMNDSLKRAFRTFIQGAVGVLALLAIPILQDWIQTALGGGQIEIDLNAWRTIGLAVIAGGVIALVSLLQNWAEDKTGKTPIPK